MDGMSFTKGSWCLASRRSPRRARRAGKQPTRRTESGAPAGGAYRPGVCDDDVSSQDSSDEDEPEDEPGEVDEWDEEQLAELASDDEARDGADAGPTAGEPRALSRPHNFRRMMPRSS
jgi:hypothetical protein